jgi:hypothetical protein
LKYSKYRKWSSHSTLQWYTYFPLDMSMSSSQSHKEQTSSCIAWTYFWYSEGEHTPWRFVPPEKLICNQWSFLIYGLLFPLEVEFGICVIIIRYNFHVLLFIPNCLYYKILPHSRIMLKLLTPIVWGGCFVFFTWYQCKSVYPP